MRKVIDVSGDGPNNSGPPVSFIRDAVVEKGITINGLPVVNDRPNPWGGDPPQDLAGYYRANVIGGPGAFLVVADGFDAFAQAILSKLLLEISGLPPAADHAAQAIVIYDLQRPGAFELGKPGLTPAQVAGAGQRNSPGPSL